MKKNRVIVFEEIQNHYRLLLKWYLMRRFDIFYYRIGRSCKQKAWIKRLVEKKLLNEIDDKYNLLNTAIGYYPDLAYQNIDKMFEAFLKEDRIAELLTKLYKDDSIYNAFKKSLLGYLQRFYYINFILHKLNEFFPKEKIHFVPALKKEGYRTCVLTVYEYRFFYNLALNSRAFSFETEDIVWPIWFNLVCKIYYLLRRVKIQLEVAGFVLLSTAVSFKNLLTPRTPRKNYKFGVIIISPAHQFANKIRKVDFLIDEEKIKKRDVLFIYGKKLSRHHRLYLQEHRLEFCDDLFYKINLKNLKTIIPIAISLLVGTFRFRRRKHIFLIESALSQLVCFAIWKSFQDRYHIENLISHCDFGLQSVVRNTLLSNSDTRTWYYTDAINWVNFFISDKNKDNIPLYSHALGFLNYDHFVTWSDELISYFKLHHQDIKKYINVGCIWASHIKEIEERKIDSRLLLDVLHSHGFTDRHKLISVFDSTYSDYTITPYEDGINFLQGIYRLLGELPDIFILFKEKKARNFIRRFSTELVIWLEKLQEHPRCYLPLRDMNTSEAIAFSDLTISFPFTSTTFEALSARKKAVYYDVAGEFRGTFYDNVKGLVCHSFDELLKRTKELLFEIDEPAYNKYLDEFVKIRIEPYLDGNALTRFRELLTNSK